MDTFGKYGRYGSEISGSIFPDFEATVHTTPHEDRRPLKKEPGDKTKKPKQKENRRNDEKIKGRASSIGGVIYY